ncbi:SGNH/GDSL hydrolase family protein [Lusitaniella coriacea]|uniref:SGNH/GDSL hydrolase family protein n=1 Tax=Lusitaniella coriacea TaxID=1983105 RepID=UPI003CE8B970
MKFFSKVIASVAVTTIASLTLFESSAQAFTLTTYQNSLSTLRILPYGDSNTRGYKNPSGYRNDLQKLFKDRGFKVDFVGEKQWCDVSDQSFGNTKKNNSCDKADPKFLDLDHEGIGGIRINEMLGETPEKGRENFVISGSVNNVFDKIKNDSPLIVLLMAGTNDIIGQKQKAKDVIEELGKLVDEISEQNTDAIFVSTIQPFGSEHPLVDESKEYNKSITESLKNKINKSNQDKVFVVDHELLEKDAKNNTNVHSNSNGYTQMANKWFESILYNAERISIVDNEISAGTNNSAGALSINGNLDVVVNSRLSVQIGGTSQGKEYDFIDVGQKATFSGSNLDISLLNGFIPKKNDVFEIVSAKFLKFLEKPRLFNNLDPISQTINFDIGNKKQGQFKVFVDDNTIKLSNFKKTTPEPGMILGLMAIAGMGLSLKRKSTRV